VGHRSVVLNVPLSPSHDTERSAVDVPTQSRHCPIELPATVRVSHEPRKFSVVDVVEPPAESDEQPKPHVNRMTTVVVSKRIPSRVAHRSLGNHHHRESGETIVFSQRRSRCAGVESD